MVLGVFMNQEKLISKLKRFKIPDSEYSLWEPHSHDSLYLEKADMCWNVYKCFGDGRRKNLGEFYSESDAMSYLFYLLMKNHYDIKKRWW